MAKRIKDEYEIAGELGSGGMAVVYKAVQRSLGRPVAIKELKKPFHADPVIVQRFEREARLAASFQHENIVHIYDFCDKPEFCIVMEYVDGVTLAQVLDTTGPLPADVGVMIGLQVAGALEYAHRRGLIHRDIKPGNIMIRRNGEVKLMDFGIARTRDLDALTQPGILVGTPSYMSPEQSLGQPLDVRSDIFSLGVVLYEMFTGAKPFQDEATQSIVAKIREARYLSPRSINTDIPRSIQRIIRKCLRKKPYQRYDSMHDLGRALGRRIRGMDKAASLKRISDFLVGSGLVEAPPEDETVVIYRAPGMGAFTKLLLASGAVLVALAAAVGLYSWSRMHEAPDAKPGQAARTEPAETLNRPTTSISMSGTASAPPADPASAP